MKKETIKSNGLLDHTIKVLKKNSKTFLVATVLFGLIYTFIYGLWLIPAIGFGFHRDSAVTVLDWAYLPLVSLMSGSLVTLMKYKLNTMSTSTIGGFGGVVAGLGAASCPVCQGVTIAAFGGNIAFLSFGDFSPFVWVFQATAVFILWISLYLTANNLYTNNCIGCISGRKPR